jgi:hypothetical protein
VQQLNDVWEFLDDNSFALDLFDPQQSESSNIWPQQVPKLCDRCRHLNFWTSNFALKDTLTDLKTRSLRCDFCSLLFTTCTPERMRISDSNTLEFYKFGSGLRMKEINKPVLSICRARMCRQIMHNLQLSITNIQPVSQVRTAHPRIFILGFPSSQISPHRITSKSYVSGLRTATSTPNAL